MSVKTDPDQRPTALQVRPENIPAELKRWPQWVLWRYEWAADKKKWDKPPRQVRGGGLASSTDRRTWDTFENALERYRAGGYDGLGFCPSAKDPFVFADHDEVVVDRELDPEVARLVRDATYAELSPSGEGVRQILKGKLPGKGRKNGHHEVYDQGHYLTITGQKLHMAPAEIRVNPRLVVDLYALIQKSNQKQEPVSHPDAPRRYGIHERGGRIRQLFGKLNSEGLPLAEIERVILGVNEREFDPPKPEADLLEEVRACWDLYQSENGQGPAKRGGATRAAPTPADAGPGEPRTLNEVEAVWAKWMAVATREKAADPYPLRVVMGAYAANRLEGDPVWVMLVAGSGSGKTEAARSISGLADVRLRSAITGLPALLSATPKKDRTAGATGGLLREVGAFGVIVLKDFTTILSMHREARAEILAALREIYDGEWTRSVGSEGARTLVWQGKVGLIAASTAAVDNAHQALSVMGSRFLFARLPDVGRRVQGGRAIRQGSREAQMHQELSDVVRGLLENLPTDAPELLDVMVDRIVEVADLAALARSPVERDYRGEVELVGDPEAPTRIAKQLAQLYRGLLWIGLNERLAWTTVARVALDSIPKLRRAIVEVLAATAAPLTTRLVAGQVNHPKTTTERALEDLDAHGVVDRYGDEQGTPFTWTLSALARTAYAKATTEPEMSEGASD